jgi:hypothetical protein
MKVEKNIESFYIFVYILLEVIIRLYQFGVLVKHLEKICSVFGGHLISINFLPKKSEGYYAYSSIVEGFLHL